MTDTSLSPLTQTNTQAVLAYVADVPRHYPGEDANFYVRVEAFTDLSDCALHINIPEGLQLNDFNYPAEWSEKKPYIDTDSQNQTVLIWPITHKLPGGASLECQIKTLVPDLDADWNFTSRAALVDETGYVICEESASIQIHANGQYLSFLPEIFAQDEIMNRFLMLFESFWAPLENQIKYMDNYLDPKTAPPTFVPWLSSWLGVPIDQHLPVEKQRELAEMSFSLLRRRGTRQGLMEMLQIVTGGDVEIIEHCTNNFQIGPKAFLGPGIALGKRNHPHTFSVYIKLAKDFTAAQHGFASLSEFKHSLEHLIDSYKPAHTQYTLKISS
jgi:phage tail-like protein